MFVCTGCKGILWTVGGWCVHKAFWTIQVIWGPVLFLGIIFEFEVIFLVRKNILSIGGYL